MVVFPKISHDVCPEGIQGVITPTICDHPDGISPQISRNSLDQEDRMSVATILELAAEMDKESKCNQVESLPEVKSIDSIESVRSLESEKSMVSQNDSTKDSIKTEKWYYLTLQVLFPFLIAGSGTIGAGLTLGRVEKDEVFTNIDSLYILVPAILGLKGNLDMCLASRLSTLANLGKMKKKREIMKIVIGNVALVQVQAIVAAVVVSVYAVCISALLVNSAIDVEHVMLVICCSVLTATLSCFALDLILTVVIFVSHKFRINPDNVATPFAASIGDVVSLNVLSLFASNLYAIHENYYWTLYIIVGVYVLVLLPAWTFVVLKNKYTKPILTHGWIPVLSALCISGFSGLVLDKAVSQFRGFVVFQPIINGVGGNLVSVQASRISTMLHKSSLPGILPPHTKQWVWPWTALVTGVLSAKTARILILISIPGQVLFVILADLFYNSWELTVTPAFVSTYVTVGLTQIMLLLYIAHLVTHFLWMKKMDPDSSAIPYLTALGDLFGSGLLLLAFHFLRAVGCEYEPVS